jgi:hypothetical protein
LVTWSSGEFPDGESDGDGEVAVDGAGADEAVAEDDTLGVCAAFGVDDEQAARPAASINAAAIVSPRLRFTLLLSA